MATPYRTVPVEVVGPVIPPEQPEAPEEEPTRGRWAALPGVLSLAAAVVAAVLQAIGIVVASGNSYAAGTTLAYLAIVFSLPAVLGGIVSVLLSRGKRWGVAAIILGLIGNPMVLLAVLRLFSGFESP